MTARSAKGPTVVVDGSNLATEGRTAPSLAQLDEAVTAYRSENPRSEIIVVADATFEHRVGASERAKFKEAELAGEIVTPPAGAVGRGDAFILKIADRVGAVVLSNDSFQEFHQQYPWLFEVGRLVGGKPVPGVGWVFTARLPVRGARSAREERLKKASAAPPKTVPAPEPAPAAKPPRTTKAVRTTKVVKAEKPEKPERPKKSARPTTKVEAIKAPRAVKVAAKTPRAPRATPEKSVKVTKARAATKAPSTLKATASAKVPRPAKAPTTKPAAATAPAAEPVASLTRGRQPVNPEADFATFVDQHRVRSKVSGKVVAFSSHGAIIGVPVGDGRMVECYAPTTRLGTPPPARARDALKRGETRDFRLVSVDRERRIAELALR